MRLYQNGIWLKSDGRLDLTPSHTNKTGLIITIYNYRCIGRDWDGLGSLRQGIWTVYTYTTLGTSLLRILYCLMELQQTTEHKFRGRRENSLSVAKK